jgi:hypothetical protein
MKRTLESLKSEKFGTLSRSEMALVLGGEIVPSQSMSIKTKIVYQDRYELNKNKDIVCKEYLVNGVWVDKV